MRKKTICAMMTGFLAVQGIEVHAENSNSCTSITQPEAKDAVTGCDSLQDTEGDLHNSEDRDNL